MRRLLTFLCIGFVSASLLIYLFGDAGVVAYGRLAEYRNRLEANVGELSALNAKLTVELESLRTSPEKTAVLAREIGIFGEKDRVIRLEGMARRGSSYAVGNLLKLSKPGTSKNPTLKASGAAVAAFLAAVALILRGLARKRGARDARRRG